MKVFGIPNPGDDAQDMEIPTPTLTGSEVLVKVTNSGVCHSDVHLREGHVSLGSVGQIDTADLGATLPLVIGHEVVGTVAEAGPEATVKPGDEKYIVFPWIGCGECQACTEDRENYCTGNMRNLSLQLKGGFAEHLWIPDEKYLVPVGDLDPSWAATLACSGVTSYSAVEKVLTADTSAPIAVIGVGGVGLSAVALLKSLGHQNIVAADVNEKALENAKAVGAHSTVLTTGDDPTAALLEAAGGKLHGAIDFVGIDATAALALSSLATGGKMVSVGLFGGVVQYPIALLAISQLKIEGNYVGSLPQLKKLVELAQTTDLPKLPITEKPLSAETINSTLRGLADGEIHGRVVMVA